MANTVEIQEITEENNPEIWALLQPPEVTDESEVLEKERRH